MPSVITPMSVTPERQWYLYENIRPLTPLRAQDILCPKLSCPRITFSQVRAAKEAGKKQRTHEGSKTENTEVGQTRKSKQTEPATYQESEGENEGLPPPKRRKATCTYTVTKQGTLIRWLKMYQHARSGAMPKLLTE
jgi:hypothetical protein